MVSKFYKNQMGSLSIKKKYALDVLQRFGMDKSNSIPNPIVPSTNITRDEGVKVNKTYYKQIVG